MGVKGWHSRGYLPHYDGYGVSQHIVFRLHDAVPAGERDGDDILDRGHGTALLRERSCAVIVAKALLYGDPERYLLQAWCVIPNHVHALLASNEKHELGAIVRLWKAYTAAFINKLLGRKGRLWAVDYFDRYMRDQTHFDTTKQYIEQNPVAAGLCARAQDWPYSSAGWKRDANG